MAGDPLKKGRYTNFGNKIGLFSNKTGNFISNSPEVVLNFPFKDIVLEAGMAKEDSGREERFLHIEMDAKDIDTLEDRKVLTNFKYIDRSGEHALDENSDIEFFDENGELKQNLLIKGNNLLALHTLKEKLAGKVKLIYIDPPYYFSEDKNSDTFSYNSNFKLSAWLTFMRNRIEISKELLSNNGVILISIDEDGQSYLKILLDEIFGQNNFISTFIWRRSGTGGLRGQFPITTHEYIIAFAKNKEKITNRWNAPYSEASLSDFKESDNRGRYKTQLEEIYQDMQKNAFLKFFFDKKEFEKDENFRSLSLDERKQKLVDILDENQFYLNYAEMNDAKYHVSDAEKVLTDRFYQTKEESEDAEE